ncbi:MAG: hypothetical protein LKF30_05655 [Sphingobium sp.]|jgi:hypothetical protein|nr:hypothetical protein [Sphingobium sp.]MCI1757334.1 hypothetical protein [Sphingobium sp.]MCI2053166.1 hypothetical protein [Sphingobium sp.]
MYSVFDQFCRRPTWDTFHPSDLKKFKAALEFAAQHPKFSPEEMGEYIRQNHTQPMWPKSSEQIGLVITRLVREAHRYLNQR